MNLLKRLWYFIIGRSHKFLDAIENPEEHLRAVTEELDKQIVKLHQSVTSAMVDEKKLRLQLDSTLAEGPQWEDRAKLALKEGNEDLARQALVKKESSEQSAEALRGQWETQKEATEQLKHSLQDAKAKVDQAKRDYAILMAKYRSVETKQKLQKTLSTQSPEAPTALMKKLEEKILRLEAESEADLDMMGASAGADLEAKFAEIENSRRGDAALAQLKASMSAEDAEPKKLKPGQDKSETEQLKDRLRESK